ncbi:MAG: cyclic nucleotide-binding domain-containing protein [Anaerolineae bacterium]|jgi:CRP-like cAMP-binding protein|nr:cyclic nucleotide-binding domain-containing protein [Anaerolineae bacterium]MBT3713730.1 cyclic nucleotide-binding domain-containing protein [Anaerolineae bacterium]MBT4310013.1 cyclic nucleotide-binding domain-containing protein [Anaerolineae bacterium]MBT4458009.1 cyclic nucleotide-binding domain-containing protein [Anaerolineae bacterium]MBT6060860.1 cyclic nucleotide-binding domain-containing protein [Anaerolineae bacterium]
MDVAFENLPFFDGLSKKTLKIIKPLFESCICHEGTIFEQGDPAIHLYFVTKGGVDILYKPYDAPAITITEVKKGGIFGWSAISDNTLYTSGAKCRVKCQAMRIQGSTLRKLCIQYPQTGEILLDRLAESVSTRWQDAHSQVRDILAQGISPRKESES